MSKKRYHHVRERDLLYLVLIKLQSLDQCDDLCQRSVANKVDSLHIDRIAIVENRENVLGVAKVAQTVPQVYNKYHTSFLGCHTIYKHTHTHNLFSQDMEVVKESNRWHN